MCNSSDLIQISYVFVNFLSKNIACVNLNFIFWSCVIEVQNNIKRALRICLAVPLAIDIRMRAGLGSLEGAVFVLSC